MNKVNITYAFRQATDTDRNFILNSWLKTWRSEVVNREISPEAYYQQAHHLFNSILDRFPAVIACNPDDPDQIYSYAVAAYLPNDEWVLFWIQTKKLYEKLGIAKALYKFIRGNRKHGPTCPFVRGKARPFVNKYDVVDAPMMLPTLLILPSNPVLVEDK